MTTPGALRRLLALLVLSAVLTGACSAGGGSTPARSAAPTAGPSAGTAQPTGFGPGCATVPEPSSLPTAWTKAATTPTIYPVIVTSQVVCGTSRFLFAFTDAKNNPISQPNRTASVTFFNLGRDPSTATSTVQGEFIYLIAPSGTAPGSGIYISTVTLPEAGEWGAEFTTAGAGGAPETVRVRFQVQPTSSSPIIGSVAPSARTATAADAGGDVKKISTDNPPDPRFYQVSLDQALAAHKPVVLVFATPKFCTSRTCGPMLERVKALAGGYPDVTFINVEPYQLTFANNQLQPVLDAQRNLQLVAASTAYGLLSEPWVFVVGANGKVTGTFESVADDAEFKAAIAAAQKAT